MLFKENKLFKPIFMPQFIGIAGKHLIHITKIVA